MEFDDLIDDPIEFIMFDEITNGEWRDEYRCNNYDIYPDDYESLEEFLDAYNDAKTQRLEDEEYNEEYLPI